MGPIIFNNTDNWRKKVENHILAAYFMKQAEPFFGGVDLIRGGGDIPDLLVEVSLFANNFTVIRWIPKELSKTGNEAQQIFYLGPVSVEEIHLKEENNENREESGSERQAVSQSITEE